MDFVNFATSKMAFQKVCFAWISNYILIVAHIRMAFWYEQALVESYIGVWYIMGDMLKSFYSMTLHKIALYGGPEKARKCPTPDRAFTSKARRPTGLKNSGYLATLVKREQRQMTKGWRKYLGLVMYIDFWRINQFFRISWYYNNMMNIKQMER